MASCADESEAANAMNEQDQATRTNSATVSPPALREFAAGVLTRLGMAPENAVQAAAAIVESDLSGADGHGIFRLPQYARRMRAGGMDPRAEPRVVADAPASALLDGGNGLGHLTLLRAVGRAVEKATVAGAAWIGVRGGNHAGAASTWAAAMLPHDMIGIYIAVGSANHLAPWGGIDQLLSTNPIAIAVPAHEEPPVVMDMATTVAAYGKVKLAAQRGETMPVGWMIDRTGAPITDPTRAEDGLLLPAGGYKGYALAFMFGLLAGTLNDAAFGADVIDFNKDDTSRTNTGQALLAISLSRFGDPAAFRRRVDAVVRQMRASALLPGAEPVRVPGDGRHACRTARERDGITLPAPLLRTLDRLAADVGWPMLPREA
jgi:L-2-hydroxycarboxylate dehydrogenase (NAD+)